jgi:hypothetical protein
MRADRRIAEHIELAEWTCRLEYRGKPTPRPPVGRPSRDIPPLDDHSSLVDDVEPGDASEQRRLARSVRPDEASQGSRSNGQRDIVDGPNSSEGLGDTRELACVLHVRLDERSWNRSHEIQAT